MKSKPISKLVLKKTKTAVPSETALAKDRAAAHAHAAKTVVKNPTDSTR